jgi:large subunit ribosomal protein L23
MSFLDKFRKKVDKKRLESKSKKEEIIDLGGQSSKSSKAASAEKKEKVRREDTGRAYHILSKPVVTEKLTAESRYGFRVSSDANKIEIARAIERVYGVRPVAINIINVRGKNIRYGRTSGKTSSWKKAIVTLKQGDKIDIFEG